MDLHYLGLLEVSRLIAAREISPVEVTEALLRRIERLDPTLKSYVLVTADLAMEEARAAEAAITREGSRGPLHGVPIALKDLFDARGIKTAAGMPMRRNYAADKDSTVVRRLRDAGAIVLGNLKMTEGAHSEHYPPVFEAPLNPWNRDLWSGASSSGSGVATAAGLCYAALGTDTGGSIRFPAAVNGVTGLKPTWGRVSRAGVFELAATLDHVGPLARGAADAGAVLGAIAGPDPDDPTASQVRVPDYLADLGADLHKVKIGLDRELALGGSDSDVESAIDRGLEVLKTLGAEIVTIKMPDVTPMARSYLALSGVQTALAHSETYPSRRREYGPALASVIELGRSLSAVDYHKLLLQQLDFRSRLHALFNEIHLFAVPVLQMQVPTLEQRAGLTDGEIENMIRFTSPFSMSGHPTISVPCGFGPDRSPISLQLVGPYFGETVLIKVADAFQWETDWHKRQPIP
jgi:amidase